MLRMLDRGYDCLAEDQPHESFQILLRVTGEGDVVELSVNEKLHATLGSMRFI